MFAEPFPKWAGWSVLSAWCSCTLCLTAKKLAEPKEYVFAMASKGLTTLQLYKVPMSYTQGLKSAEFRPCSLTYRSPFVQF